MTKVTINLDTTTNKKRLCVAFKNHRGNACCVYPTSITAEDLAWLALDGAGDGVTHTGETLLGHPVTMKIELTGRTLQKVPSDGAYGIRAKVTFLNHDFSDGFFWGEPDSCFVYEITRSQ